MRNKFLFLLLGNFLILTSSVFAVEFENINFENSFSAKKNEAINMLGEERAIIDQAISCINAAIRPSDAKKCRDVRKINLEKLLAKRKKGQKQNLEQGEQKSEGQIDNKAINPPSIRKPIVIKPSN